MTWSMNNSTSRAQDKRKHQDTNKNMHHCRIRKKTLNTKGNMHWIKK